MPLTARKRKIVFLGNCQSQSLATVYRERLAFYNDDLVTYIDIQNVRTSPAEGAKALAEADTVVLQLFDFPTKLSAADLRPECKIMKFPSVVAGFYWPFASQHHIHTPKGEIDPPYPAQLGDRILNGYIAKGLDPAAALKLYLEMDVASVAGLDRLFELYMDRQEQRDKAAGIDVAPVLLEHFRDEQIFLTPDHPNLRVFGVLARNIYQMLGSSETAVERALDALPATPFPHSALPIHPSVIKHFGLKFADEKTRYPYLEEGSFTFEEYVLRYMKYEWNEELKKGILGDDPLPERLETLSRGLRKSPDSVVGWRVLAELLLRQEKPLDAHSAACRSCMLGPANADSWVTYYRTLVALKDLDGAKRIAADCVAKFPQSSTIHYLAAESILHHGGNMAECVKRAESAVRLQSGNPHAHYLLGLSLTRSGDLTGAEESMRAAIEIAPANTEFKRALDRILSQKN